MSKHRLKPTIIGHRCEGWVVQRKWLFWWVSMSRRGGDLVFFESEKEAAIKLIEHLNKTPIING